MRRPLGVILLACAVCWPASAVMVGVFTDTDTYLERARGIVVADCVGQVGFHGMAPRDGLKAYEVNVLKVLKGELEPGELRVATIYEMEPHVTYLLRGLDGKALGSSFIATSELSVVPLPRNFKVEDLANKDVKEQVQYLFSLRLYEVECELAPLLEEKEHLSKAVADRMYGWFDSNGPVQLGPIAESTTEELSEASMYLDLEGQKLQWSQSSPGESGFLYFAKVAPPSHTPYWEFAASDVAKVEDLAGKPLRVRFYGMYTPGRAGSPLKWTAYSGAIDVRVGQVVLARTSEQPDKVYVIQIVRQETDREQLSFRYAVIVH